MRPIGISTGALAKGDFQNGLKIARDKALNVIELSALRWEELPVLVEALPQLDLKSFSYVSVHAPSRIESQAEYSVVSLLEKVVQRKFPVVVHPDTITRFELWKDFGSLLCIENMDNRKTIGRRVAELEAIFQKLPKASFCFDIGHACQVDPTMSEAASILRNFVQRLKQVHVSEVTTRSKHGRLTLASIHAFNKVHYLIPDSVPLILETPVSARQISQEIGTVRQALPTHKASVLSRAV